MTAQQAGMGAIMGWLIWWGLNWRHRRQVQLRMGKRIPRDDGRLVVVVSAPAIALLSVGLLARSHLGFGVALLLAAIGCVVESTVRVVPHLRSGEQKLAMDHIVMGVALLGVLVLSFMGWNRLPPLVPGM
ncbi:MAG TPA: hypothetical protein G4O02_11985 [Caldilineae bacterium]|nr:hypothetical protein [Caldilineae bacterium]